MRSMQIFFAAAALLAVLGASGCGQIVDKDRVVVARVDGEAITRGDLYAHIRRMDDTQRPNIRTRNDLKRVLTGMIDERIKEPMGEAIAETLSDEQKAGLRLQARELFFATKPDDSLRRMYEMEVPPAGEETELMKQYGINYDTLMVMRDQVELGTDEQYEKLLAELALIRAAADAYRAGTLTLDPAALEREYERQKENLKTFEWMKFRAIRFPAVEGSERRAAEVREQLEGGASFDDLFKQFAGQEKGLVVESEIENNPSLAKFQNFWLNASGAEPGAIIGPVYLPEYTQQAETADGKVIALPQPASYLVLQVLERKDGETAPLEAVRDRLAQPLVIAQKMEDLYKEHNVEIFEDLLPDPSAFGSGATDPLAF